MDVLASVKAFPALFRTRWKNAFPTIVFYSVLFFLVCWLFGKECILVIISATSLFQIRRRQYNTHTDYLWFFFIPLVLTLLAFLATQNVVLCVLLNLCVPMFLVLWKSSQFTPKGYLGFAMTFVFMELRPATLKTLPVQLAAVVLCFGLLGPALALQDRLLHRVQPPLVQIRALLADDTLPRSRLRIFYHSFLHMLLLLTQAPASPVFLSFWRLSPQSIFSALRRRFSPDRFEVRFALRLAVVMTISCTVSLLWDFERTYWFPLHTFLLLQPSYEESAQRMVTRPIGTAIGCVVVHLIYPLLPGLPGVFAFSLVMISLMYCSTPGTWVQPIFSTSFSLTMVSLSIQTSQAIQLRLLYLAMAVVLVLVVNRFLLPSRQDTQFQRNFKALFQLQADYWGVIRRSLREPVAPALFSELLAQFHMTYHEVSLYLRKLSQEAAAPFRERLITLWGMFSELEQVECLIQTNRVSQQSQPPLYDLAGEIQCRIAQPEHDLTGLSLDGLPKDDLYYVLERYFRNAGAFAVMPTPAS